jgi:hypothetical protein
MSGPSRARAALPFVALALLVAAVVVALRYLGGSQTADSEPDASPPAGAMQAAGPSPVAMPVGASPPPAPVILTYADGGAAPQGTLVVVVDDPSGAPIGRAHVTVRPNGPIQPAVGPFDLTTDGSGSASLTVPASQYGATLDDPSYATAEGTQVVATGKTATITLLAIAGLQVAGQVVDASGHPVAEARVFANKAMSTTDENGHFELRVPPGPIRLGALAPGGGQGTLSVNVQPGVNLTQLTIMIGSGADVVVEPLCPAGPCKAPQARIQWQGGVVLAGPDPDGALRLSQVAPGVPCTLVVKDFSTPKQRLAATAVLTLSPGESRRISLDLQPMADLVASSGQVIGPDGAPVQARIVASCSDSLGPGTSTKADGSFTLEKLIPGPCSLQATVAREAGTLGGDVSFQAPAADVRVVVEPLP